MNGIEQQLRQLELADVEPISLAEVADASVPPSRRGRTRRVVVGVSVVVVVVLGALLAAKLGGSGQDEDVPLEVAGRSELQLVNKRDTPSDVSISLYSGILEYETNCAEGICQATADGFLLEAQFPDGSTSQFPVPRTTAGAGTQFAGGGSQGGVQWSIWNARGSGTAEITYSTGETEEVDASGLVPVVTPAGVGLVSIRAPDGSYICGGEAPECPQSVSANTLTE